MAYAELVRSLGPVAYYPLNDASSLPVDRSGNNNTALVASSITYRSNSLLPGPGPGSDDRSLLTQGGTSNVQFSKVISPAASQTFSLDFWFQLTSLTFHPSFNVGALLYIGTGSAPQEMSLYAQNAGPGQTAFIGVQMKAPGSTGTSVMGTSTTAFMTAINTTYHFTMTSSAANGVRMYAQGALTGSAAYTGAVGSYGTQIYMGYSPDTFWAATATRFSHVSFFTRELTSSEVGLLHREGYRGGVVT